MTRAMWLSPEVSFRSAALRRLKPRFSSCLPAALQCASQDQEIRRQVPEECLPTFLSRTPPTRSTTEVRFCSRLRSLAGRVGLDSLLAPPQACERSWRMVTRFRPAELSRSYQLLQPQ